MQDSQPSHWLADHGSAVVEFALLALPLCLMTIAATNYSLNVYFDTLLRAGANSAARFASLADTSLIQAQENLDAYCAKEFRLIAAQCRLGYSAGERQVAQVRIIYRPLSLLVYQPSEVIIDASAGLEIAK